jgi:N-acetyl-alpha-D-glucosaminyl L-malate synthase BshA
MAKQMLAEEGIHIPMVTTLHGTDITLVGNHPFYKPAVTFSINNSDCVTSVSKSLKDDTLRLFNIKKEIKVIPNFIDTKNFSNPYTECQRDLMALPEERIITHVSNLRPVKRVNDIIRIFYLIQKKIPSKLLVVGEGPESAPAALLAEELGISDKVLFMGNSNEVDKILRFSDLFLLPSEKESFGLAALEAMASGVPVISSNTGGLSEVNIQVESGYLSNVGNVTEMAENAIKILKDDATLNAFKIRAKASAIRFDTDTVVPQYEAIYRDAIAGTC